MTVTEQMKMAIRHARMYLDVADAALDAKDGPATGRIPAFDAARFSIEECIKYMPELESTLRRCIEQVGTLDDLGPTQ